MKSRTHTRPAGRGWPTLGPAASPPEDSHWLLDALKDSGPCQANRPLPVLSHFIASHGFLLASDSSSGLSSAITTAPRPRLSCSIPHGTCSLSSVRVPKPGFSLSCTLLSPQQTESSMSASWIINGLLSEYMNDLLYGILILDPHIPASTVLCDFPRHLRLLPKGSPFLSFPVSSSSAQTSTSALQSPTTSVPLQKVLFSSPLTYPYLLFASSF